MLVGPAWARPGLPSVKFKAHALARGDDGVVNVALDYVYCVPTRFSRPLGRRASPCNNPAVPSLAGSRAEALSAQSVRPPGQAACRSASQPAPGARSRRRSARSPQRSAPARRTPRPRKPPQAAPANVTVPQHGQERPGSRVSVTFRTTSMSMTCPHRGSPPGPPGLLHPDRSVEQGVPESGAVHVSRRSSSASPSSCRAAPDSRSASSSARSAPISAVFASTTALSRALAARSPAVSPGTGSPGMRRRLPQQYGN